MRFHAIAAAVSVFLLNSQLLADYPAFTICAAINVQKNPGIDGDIVVWEDGRHGSDNSEVYWVRLSDPNLIQNRIELPGKQVYPSVYGNTIVWQDDRASSNRDIYMYDVVSGTITNLPDTAHQRRPDVSAQAVVCESYAGGVYNVVFWNASAGQFQLIAPYSASQLDPAVDGTFVVWEDYRGGTPQIYGCDLGDGVPAFALALSAGNQLRPSISGSIIVWEEVAAETTTLKAFNIDTNLVIWTHTLPFVAASAGISDGVIVWQQYDPVDKDNDIRGYDLNSGVYLDIATGMMDDQTPVISGRTVVWQRNQSDLVAAVIPDTPPADQIVVLEPNGGEMYLSGSRVRVTWTMARGETPDSVNVDCSFDNGVSWAQTASGVPFAEPYLWDLAGEVDSPECLVRVSAANNAQIADTSDTPFTIFQCSPELTADLTGDCFVDIEDVAVLAGQWLTSGNPYDQACLNN